MSRPNHTPAPWSVEDVRGYTGSHIGYRIYGDGILVASTSWHDLYRRSYPLRAEAEANMRLVRAAPEMLDALKAVWALNYAAWADGEGFNPKGQTMSKVIAVIEAAQPSAKAA